MIIRLMTIEDYDSVYALWLNTPGMGLNDIDDSREGIAKYLDRNPSTCFVAQDNDRIVGIILSGHDGRRGYIHHTAVELSYRNKGIATQLLERTMSALEQECITKVALVVFKTNEVGNAFWEGRGFTARDDLVYRNKNIQPLKRMDT